MNRFGLLALAIVLAGCEDTPGLDDVAAVPGPHGMPVPQTARPTETLGDHTFFYEVDARLDDLRAWYTRTFVAGQSVGSFAWCTIRRPDPASGVAVYSFVDRGAGQTVELFTAQDRGMRNPGIVVRVLNIVSDDC